MRVFDAREVAKALPWPQLIERLRHGFAEGCALPLRHHHTIGLESEPDATLLLMPAWRTGEVLGVKVATVFPGNAARGLGAVQASYLLSSAVSGEPLAVIDGGELTYRRTAAASALAAIYLARVDAARLLMVGAGRLAPYLVAAHAAVRPIREVEIWARRPDQAAALVARLVENGVSARAVGDLGAAVGRADIISCATLATAPLVLGAWLSPGMHLDLVGGFTPAMREVDDEAVRRAAVFADTREGALHEAGDLVQPIERGVLRPEQVRADLFELARGAHPGRTADSEITLFKSVGTALEDLYAAALVWEGRATAP